MKKFIKISLFVVILAMTLSLCSCDMMETVNDLLGSVAGVLEDMLFATDYDFSDVVLTQKGVNEFEVSFTANTGADDVKVYLSKSFSSVGSAEPETVTKTVLDGDKVRYSFTKDLSLGEDQYVWVVCGEKEAMTAFTVPSTFPTVSVNDKGESVFNFGYTYGTDWGSYCDQQGKALYYSTKPVFDSAAVLIEDGIALGTENYTLPADIPADVYFFATAEARDGKVLSISAPVMSASSLLDEIAGISAKIYKNKYLCVEIAIPESSDLSASVVDSLNIMVKNGSADEIYVVDCSYAGGVATLLFDCSQLIIEGNWYDVILCWNGATVTDVPTMIGDNSIVSVDSGKIEDVNYKITDWNSLMKVYFEKDPQKAELLFDSYSFSFDAETASLIATVTLKEGAPVPTLGLTAGDKDAIVTCKGVKNADGTYTYTLSVADAMTEAGKWYDVRFFVDKTVYETYKSEGISDDNYSAKYENGNRVYDFQSWENLLKLQFNNK